LLLAYQRLDTCGRPIPEHCISLPDGLNVKSYDGHLYCYEPIILEVQGKKSKKRNQAMLSLLQKHSNYVPSLMQKDNYLSIEWVGTEFKKYLE